MKLQIPARRLVVGALAIATAIAATASAPGAIAANPGETALYIVQTVSDPAAQHPTTNPAEGQKLNSRSANVRNLVSQLRGEHNRTLAAAKVDAGRKVYDYSLTFNGYAARLTEAEAARL